MIPTLPPACTMTWPREGDPAQRSAPYTVERVTTPLQLSTLRRICSLTQRELADLIGTTEASVNRLENARTPFDTRWSSHLTLLFAHLTRDRPDAV